MKLSWALWGCCEFMFLCNARTQPARSKERRQTILLATELLLASEKVVLTVHRQEAYCKIFEANQPCTYAMSGVSGSDVTCLPIKLLFWHSCRDLDCHVWYHRAQTLSECLSIRPIATSKSKKAVDGSNIAVEHENVTRCVRCRNIVHICRFLENSVQ